MKKTITRILAFVAALVCGGAWAATWTGNLAADAVTVSTQAQLSFESLLAAIYLDSGHSKKTVADFLMPLMIPKIDEASLDEMEFDYKTSLQQFVQASGKDRLQYVTVGETGPDHLKIFEVEARLNSNVVGKGKGRTKREAEQNAAKEALLLFDVK